MKPYKKTGVAILDFITEDNAKLIISHNEGVTL